MNLAQKQFGPKDLVFLSGQHSGAQPTEHVEKLEGQVNEFISFLKYFGIRPPIMFNYLSASGGLISNMSLDENIILDSISTICKEDEVNLSKILASHHNPFLKTLYEQIYRSQNLVRESVPRDRKIAAIIKTFLKKSPYIFLEHPEAYLNPHDLEIFLCLLENTLLTTQSTILLQTNIAHEFSKLITKKARRNREDCSFIIENLGPSEQQVGLRFFGIHKEI